VILSGRWDRQEAWLYAISAILAFIVSRLLAAMLGFGSIITLMGVGFDERFDWSPAFSHTAHILAFAGLMLGYAFSSWALIENRFFSGTVCIQTER
jgi:hypothetical protein